MKLVCINYYGVKVWGVWWLKGNEEFNRIWILKGGRCNGNIWIKELVEKRDVNNLWVFEWNVDGNIFKL